MRIAFVVIGNSRRSNYLNGHTLRYEGAGGSGTDSSVILVAEYLAKNNFECVIVFDDLEPQLKEKYEKKYNLGDEIFGVKYTNKNFDGIENKEFDVLVTMLWFHEYFELPIKVTKSIIYWSHMQWIYGENELSNYVNKNNLKLRFIHISEWERSMNSSTVDSICNKVNDCDYILIPNPIMDDIIQDVVELNIPKKKNKFIFHASWARGGNVAMKAIRQLSLQDKEFHAFDYLMSIHDYKDSFFYKHDGVDKKTLFMHLAESEYFIYPLYTPYQDVHKDTFSCVVAEAIALGCIVLTYPLGALAENFEGYCVWLDFPPYTDPNKIQKEALTKDLEGKFTTTINIVDKIKFLEENKQIKEFIYQKGKDYILDKFNTSKIGRMWIDLINGIV